MEQEQEKIILENSFAGLSNADKVVLSDLVNSEEEFDVLKQILITAPTLNDGIAPSPNLKASLMETFTAQNSGLEVAASATGSGKTKIILFRSVAAVAAIFILFMLLFPFRNEKSEINFTAENAEDTKKIIDNDEEPKIESENTIENDAEQNVQSEFKTSIQESLVQVAVNNAPQNDSRSASRKKEPLVEEFSGSANFFAEMPHSDRLSTYDLPAQNKQVIQENPALLDVLYTAF